MKPEDIEQCKLFDWIRSKTDLKPYCYHIANERLCTPMQGRLLKRKGVRAGVLDTKIAIPRGSYHGMYHELKVKGKKPTVQQLEFMEDMSFQGYFCAWSIGFEESKKIIEWYLSL
jgi:hypothetical protein